MAEQIKQMSDPDIKRFERDAMVQIHTKRIKELELYVERMERQVSEMQGQMDLKAGQNCLVNNNMNTLDLPTIMITGDN